MEIIEKRQEELKNTFLATTQLKNKMKTEK